MYPDGPKEKQRESFYRMIEERAGRKSQMDSSSTDKDIKVCSKSSLKWNGEGGGCWLSRTDRQRRGETTKGALS